MVAHGRSGAESSSPRKGPDDLLARSSLKAMRDCMDHVAEHERIAHEGHQTYAALRSADRSVVAVLGEFHHRQRSRSPFMRMISAA